MRKLPKMFAILLTICLSGCQTRPVELVTTQRFINLGWVEIDGKMYIDPDTSFCLERRYKFSIHFVGPTEKFYDVPLENCHKLTGYPPRAYVDVFNFSEDVRKEAESHHEH